MTEQNLALSTVMFFEVFFFFYLTIFSSFSFSSTQCLFFPFPWTFLFEKQARICLHSFFMFTTLFRTILFSLLSFYPSSIDPSFFPCGSLSSLSVLTFFWYFVFGDMAVRNLKHSINTSVSIHIQYKKYIFFHHGEQREVK